jgi:hypothetical protein
MATQAASDGQVTRRYVRNLGLTAFSSPTPRLGVTVTHNLGLTSVVSVTPRLSNAAVKPRSHLPT